MAKRKGKRCPYCKGAGNEIQFSTIERRLYRIMGIPTVEYKRCSYCQGTGHLNFEAK